MNKIKEWLEGFAVTVRILLFERDLYHDLKAWQEAEKAKAENRS